MGCFGPILWRDIFLIFFRKVHLPSADTPIFAQYFEEMSGWLIRKTQFGTNTLEGLKIFFRICERLTRTRPFWPNTMRGLFVPVGRSGCSFYRVSPPHWERGAAKCSFLERLSRNESRQVRRQVVLPRVVDVSACAACMFNKAHAPNHSPSSFSGWVRYCGWDRAGDHAAASEREDRFVRVNVRDFALLEFGLEQKFMTLNQIGRMFYPGNDKVFNWPMKCVCKLVEEGLLVVEKPGFCEPRLYRVTAKGARLLRKHGLGNELAAIEQINTKCWEHDLWVTDVRIIFFRKLGLKLWKPERLLKQENVKQKVPDGIVHFKSTDLVIEVERTLKKKEYYEKILTDTCSRQFRNQEIILYIMTNEADKRWLMKLAGGWVRIYFATIDDLKEMKDSVTFLNAEGKQFVLHQKEDHSNDRTSKGGQRDGDDQTFEEDV